MNDERFLKDWLRDTSDDASDPSAAADKVVARLPETPQRRRWLPWLPVRRRPPTDDQPPNITGRTRSMLSSATIVAAGTLVLAVAGIALLASPQANQGVHPGADGPDPAPRMFSGSLKWAPGCSNTDAPPRVEVKDDVSMERESISRCFLWATTDPRLNGQSTVVWNGDTLDASEDSPGGVIQSGRERIATPDGTWEGTLTHLKVGDGLTLESGWYVGSGAHDGLVAYITLQDDGDSLWGYVSAEPPPVPEMVPASD